MSAITFDTLKLARDAGVPGEQAEAFANAFRDATSDELVTRDYLNACIADVETRVEAAKADIIKWMAGLLIAQAAVVAMLVKLL
ncbi:hypothetical protein [Thiohalocapsa sp. ML1]|uniref:hypothetical protein n=1 Tax=Thiohalocapsa sp. ML1 TaxID=1431688 RepID=UPI000732221E|nr:hypothetical protein [Thiohalocapsa sp. ML1]